MSERSTAQLSGVICFSGAHIGAVGAVTSFLANGGAAAGATMLIGAQGFPAPSGSHSLRNLRARCPSNALAAALTATVYVNGVASTLTVSITAASTATFTDSTHTVAVAAGDLIDLRLDSNAAGVATATIVGSVEIL